MDIVATATAGLGTYYFWSVFLSIFLAYKMVKDQRFKTPDRYFYALAVLFLPFVDGLYLGHLGYRNRDILKKYWQWTAGKIKKV